VLLRFLALVFNLDQLLCAFLVFSPQGLVTFNHFSGCFFVFSNCLIQVLLYAKHALKLSYLPRLDQILFSKGFDDLVFLNNFLGQACVVYRLRQVFSLSLG
jgi:hypothetical protein